MAYSPTIYVNDSLPPISAENLNKSEQGIADNDIAISFLSAHKVAQPLDSHNQPTDGTNGQLLRTMGDGHTQWVDEGLPTDEQTAQAISDWLDEHPEATTTVEDGSLTVAKFSENLKLATIKDYVTPEMFGAVGDGTTDDILALKDAAETGLPIIGDPTKIYAISDGLEINSYIYNCNLKAIESFSTVLSYSKRNTIIDNVQIDCNNMASYGIAGSNTIPQDSTYIAQINGCCVKNALADGFKTGKVRTFYNSCIAQNCASSGFVIGASDTKHDCITPIDCTYGVYIGYQVGNTSIGRFHPWSWNKKQTGIYVSSQASVNIEYYFDDSNEYGITYRSGNKITVGTLACFNNTDAPSAVDSSCRLFKKDSDGQNFTTTISVNNLIGSFTNYDDYFLIPDINIDYLNIPYVFVENVATRFDKKMFRLSSIPSSMFSTLLAKFTSTSAALSIDTVEIKKCKAFVDGYDIQFVATFNTASGTQLDNTTDVLELQYTGTDTTWVNYKLENIISSFSAPSFHIVKKGAKGFSIRPNATYTITGVLVLTIDVYVSLY